MPDVGFELTTDRLQGGCSTTELIRLSINMKYYLKNQTFQDLLGNLQARTEVTNIILENRLENIATSTTIIIMLNSLNFNSNYGMLACSIL